MSGDILGQIPGRMESVEKTIAALKLENQKLRTEFGRLTEDKLGQILRKVEMVEQNVAVMKLDSQKMKLDLGKMVQRQNRMETALMDLGMENNNDLMLPNGNANYVPPIGTNQSSAQQWDRNCNKCQQKIIGYRYICLQCKNTDFCEKCETQHKLSHCLLRLPSIKQNHNHLIGQVTSLKLKEPINYLTNFVCPVCNMVGYHSYICLSCDNYHHCFTCERTHHHSNHVAIRMLFYSDKSGKNAKHHIKIQEAQKIVREFYGTFAANNAAALEAKFQSNEKLSFKESTAVKEQIETKEKSTTKENTAKKLISVFKEKPKAPETPKIKPRPRSAVVEQITLEENSSVEAAVDDEADC